MSMETFAVELGALTVVPVFEHHKRGKNWLAVIHKDPTAPGGLGRKFANRARGEYYYLVVDIKVGDVIEFGADYYTGSGHKSAQRYYGVVRDITDDSLTIEEAPTAAAAFKLAVRSTQPAT